MFNQELFCLELAENRVGDPGGMALARLLMVNEFMTELTLDANGLSDASGEAIATSLRNRKDEGFAKFRRVEMGRNNMGDIAASAFARTLRANGDLRALSLGNRVSDRGAEALAAALAFNKEYQTYGAIRVEDPGLRALSLAGKGSRTVSLTRKTTSCSSSPVVMNVQRVVPSVVTLSRESA